MSLPPVGNKVYAFLGAYADTSISPPRPWPSIVGKEFGRFNGADYVDTLTQPPNAGGPYSQSYQQPFYSSIGWFIDWPNELITPLIGGGYPPAQSDGPGVTISCSTRIKEWSWKYPDNIVTSYNPTPPPDGPGDSPPDPNGTIGTASGGESLYRMSASYLPHWHTDPSFDYGTSMVGFGVDVPDPDTEYNINTFPHQFNNPWSVDLSVTNYHSRVYNEMTMDYEFYDYLQATFEVKTTAEVIIDIKTNISTTNPYATCCWCDGVTVKGKVQWASVEANEEPVELGTEGADLYGFGGMKFTPSASLEEGSTEDWSVTITESFTPIKIDIPQSSGRLTFLNDFWITEVVPAS